MICYEREMTPNEAVAELKAIHAAVLAEMQRLSSLRLPSQGEHRSLYGFAQGESVNTLRNALSSIYELFSYIEIDEWSRRLDEEGK